MIISLIVAKGQKNEIGKQGQIPWNLPEDLSFFKDSTQGGTIIMGRRTWQSLPKRPLQGRQNIVVTSQVIEGVTTARSVEEALELSHFKDKIFGIGGAAIYEQLFPRASRLLITHVNTTISGADTFFPAFSEEEWNSTLLRNLTSQAPHAEIREWTRKKNQ